MKASVSMEEGVKVQAMSMLEPIVGKGAKFGEPINGINGSGIKIIPVSIGRRWVGDLGIAYDNGEVIGVGYIGDDFRQNPDRPGNIRLTALKQQGQECYVRSDYNPGVEWFGLPNPSWRNGSRKR